MQDTINSNKIKENKYKILRMSLLLGNNDDKEDTINNFEDASREIDAMNDEIYLKELDGKFYDTLTLEEEEKKLTVLVDYIGGRVEQRLSLLSDFSNVTGYELMNLPPIKYYDKLDEYKSRLSFIREYLSNTKNINSLSGQIDELENKLNDAYVNKAKSEEQNLKNEKELLRRFENIIKKREEFKDITVDNASLKLNDIMTLVEDSKKSLDIFNKSFNTLDQAGIDGEEEKEYLSYVNGAKEAYYNNKEIEYLIKLYIILNGEETEYSKLLVKRDAVNEIIYDRIEIRKQLEITNDDILESIYNLLERQYNDIVKQKDNIEDIEYLNEQIENKRKIVNELEQDNQKVEILSLLKEFCIIDTYDSEPITASATTDKASDIETIPNEVTNSSNISFDSNVGLNDNTELNNTSNNDIIDNNNNIFDNNIVSDSVTYQNNDSKDLTTSNAIESTTEQVVASDIDTEDYADNQVVSVYDASKINLEEAILKSNNVMKRVGEMLGVKPKTETKIEVEPKSEEKPAEKEEEKLPSKNSIDFSNNKNEESNTSQINPLFDTNISNNSSQNDFSADPEDFFGNNLDKNNTSEINHDEENPLFNNTLANTDIDEVMNGSVNMPDNDNNDFWSSGEENPIDLNSLPDIQPANGTIDPNNFFGSNNNNLSDLSFPSLDDNLSNSREGA